VAGERKKHQRKQEKQEEAFSPKQKERKQGKKNFIRKKTKKEKKKDTEKSKPILALVMEAGLTICSTNGKRSLLTSPSNSDYLLTFF